LPKCRKKPLRTVYDFFDDSKTIFTEKQSEKRSPIIDFMNSNENPLRNLLSFRDDTNNASAARCKITSITNAQSRILQHKQTKQTHTCMQERTEKENNNNNNKQNKKTDFTHTSKGVLQFFMWRVFDVESDLESQTTQYYVIDAVITNFDMPSSSNQSTFSRKNDVLKSEFRGRVVYRRLRCQSAVLALDSDCDR
jgi:hypothetical protein